MEMSVKLYTMRAMVVTSVWGTVKRQLNIYTLQPLHGTFRFKLALLVTLPIKCLTVTCTWWNNDLNFIIMEDTQNNFLTHLPGC